MNKLKFTMDDFGVHESVSYLMRDILRSKIQKMYDDWLEMDRKIRRIGPYKIVQFGSDKYSIFKGDERVNVPKAEMETFVEKLFDHYSPKEVKGVTDDSGRTASNGSSSTIGAAVPDANENI